MSVISAVKSFIATFPGLTSGKIIDVDNLDGAEWYSISPTPSEPVLETYLNNVQNKQFTFAFRVSKLTMDDLRRLENNEFFEDLQTWLKTQSDAGNLPTMDTGQTPQKIEAISWGYLQQQGQSNTGVYQILCRLEYQE